MSPTPLEIVAPSTPARLDPAWNKARELVAAVRAGGLAWLKLSLEIERLRDLFLQPPGLRRGSEAQVVLQKKEGGFQAKLTSELGLHHEQAKRWLLDGQRYRQLHLIAADQVTEIDGHKVTAEARENARAALAEIDADPTIRPARCWAGLWGAVKTKGSQRRGCDHTANIDSAIAKLKTSLPHWREIPAAERVFLTERFLAMKTLLEGTLL